MSLGESETERERKNWEREVGLYFKRVLSYNCFFRDLNWFFNNVRNILRRIEKLFYFEVSIFNYFIL